MDEIPTFVAQPLPGKCCCALNSLQVACLRADRNLMPAADGIDQGYIVLNRPYGVLQWVQQQLPLLMEDYVLMLEPVSKMRLAVNLLLAFLPFLSTCQLGPRWMPEP